MSGINLFTIGFTKKSAEQFFTRLRQAGVKRLVDVRLQNNSQLAGFSKREDLAYFLRSIAGIDYVHLLDLAPTKEMLDHYKKVSRDRPAYEQQFRELIAAEYQKYGAVVREAGIELGCLVRANDDAG